MTLTKYTASTAIIAALADLPNATSGLTAAQLKAKFDENPEAFKTFVNAMIDELAAVTDGDSGADNIGVTAITGLTGATVQTLLESMKTFVDTKSNTADTYTQTQADAKFETITDLTATRKLSATGDFTGTLNGNAIVAAEPGLSSTVVALSADVVQRGFNVKSSPFNAVGNGVTDDYAAITAALTAAHALGYPCVVYFPPGRYMTSQTIVVPIGVEIRGFSRTNTSINLMSSNVGGDVITANAASQGRVDIRDISIAGHATSGNGLVIANASGGSIISNVLISLCGNSGLIVQAGASGSFGIIIDKCYISSNGGYGIELNTNSNNAKIINSQIWNNANGILIKSSVAVIIQNNIIEDNTTFGILIEGCFMPMIMGNEIEGHIGQIFITNDGATLSEMTLITGNLIEGGISSVYAIKVDECSHTTIMGNWTRDHTGNPILVETNADLTLIANNYCHEATPVTNIGTNTIIQTMTTSGMKTTGNSDFAGLSLTPITSASAKNNGLFVDSADNLLKFKNSSGTVKTVTVT